MVPAIVLFPHLSNILLILLCGVILLSLLKFPRLTDRLWLAGIASVALIVLISIGQIVSYNRLAERLAQKEATLDTLKSQYASLKSLTQKAKSEFAAVGNDVRLSRQEYGILKERVTAEFDRTIRDIHTVYAAISDEELDRRFTIAVRKARKNLQDNVFK